MYWNISESFLFSTFCYPFFGVLFLFSQFFTVLSGVIFRSLSLEVRCLWLLAHSRGLPTSTWFRCPIAPGLELRPPYRGEKTG
ncbi:hypothetical protein KY289_037534 [Solanum tuberosum]|nr:hypothetical protein KY289_037534 [Solanum tuberosum]